MVNLMNDGILPEDTVRVLLPVTMIPHDAKVSKRNGDLEYTLKRKLTVYGIEAAKGLRPEKIREPPLIVDGFFVVGPRGSINQVSHDTLLHWHVKAADLMETLQQLWEGTPQ